MGEPQLDTINWHTDWQVTTGITDTSFKEFSAICAVSYSLTFIVYFGSIYLSGSGISTMGVTGLKQLEVEGGKIDNGLSGCIYYASRKTQGFI